MKPRAVYVEWADAHSRNAWEHYRPHREMALRVRSVAWLIHRDKKRIVLSHSMDANKRPRFMDVLTIPRSAVRKIKRIRRLR
mgnify:CR=1 FL=1